MDLNELRANGYATIEKKLNFLSWLNEELKSAKSYQFPILVGGSAVELYTLGNYGSLDLDLVMADISKPVEILKNNGFIKDGKQWYNPDIDVLVEFVGGEPPAKVLRINYKGSFVLVTSLEEIIADRLNAAKWWRSKADEKWAKVMLSDALSKPKENFDFEYLQKRSQEEDTSDVYVKLCSSLATTE